VFKGFIHMFSPDLKRAVHDKLSGEFFEATQ